MASYEGKIQIESHLSNVKTDPIRNFKFVVNINKDWYGPDGKTRPYGFTLGFMSVSGFSASTQAIPYRHGGQNTTAAQLPGQTTFQPISFSRGVLVGTNQNWQWFKEIFAVQVGGGVYLDNHGNAFRADVDVFVMPHPRTDASKFTPIARYKVFNAWPTAVSMSDLNSGDNAFIVENMVLANEGFDFWQY